MHSALSQRQPYVSGNAERDESGQFESELDDEDIVSYFAEGRPFHTAQEVSDRFGVDRSTAYRRLSRLEDDERLEKVSLGSRTVSDGTRQIWR